ncbi:MULTISPECIES: TetR/AcrR family transcriptional regulator [Mycobacteriaceae]|jgi:AcrR family transcriptional regulator|uniref:TetR/AcrR family transcriptional regulator n=1 Tax=Mycolicibacterium mucogenicum DSM 44124 TaxID=1226753 RepID=A0A8H2JA82_MYCMU|nr:MULTISPECIES: TetR/AcrR family transcriptional regulator [Mycobacteriaceae]KAB7761398.1 TetR family transcriptional regulator [Mycolicibacterium mucogenicum DSM 44124]MDX1881399.1 helix-turn-helix domain-containing protein [Mycolicibacterium sp. 141076]QPG70220.1 TetR/AcrR family transcriptional regulator [Mycolicibacterium mucogenicum DSM 44124]SEA88611.1 DNA-binding transcriptional regulator, AcrR family [Mycobacterium sp. 283mftsu]BCI83867.1 putative transcriptional regulator, TetR famil
MVDPRATVDDLTAKARIRNTALDLYAKHGEDRISLRAIAAEAGVAVGLVQHHFKTKAGLRNAVDQLVVDYFAGALAEVPEDASTAVRDAAVRDMLRANPAVVDYVRRALLQPNVADSHLVDVIVDLTQREVRAARKTGRASTTRRENTQVVAVLARQMGELLLAPMVDAVWARVAPDTKPPRLRVTVDEAGQ